MYVCYNKNIRMIILSKTTFRYTWRGAFMKKRQLYEEIMDKIYQLTTELKANTKLPSRKNLAEIYNVNRSTIDRAIVELIGKGVLYSKEGSGTFVSNESWNFHNSEYQIAVLIPNILHDTYPEIIRGIGDITSQNKLYMQIFNTDNNHEKQLRHIEDLVKFHIDGIIIVPVTNESENLRSFYILKENNIPFVVCNRTLMSINCNKVLSNNFFGGYKITQHLIEEGYKKIAFISKHNYSAVIERYHGYLAALAEANIIENPLWISIGQQPSDIDSSKFGYHIALDMINNLADSPDAFFCFDDALAQGVYYSIKNSGYEIGKDIGLVGYNNNKNICLSLSKTLTSVDYKAYDVGVKATERLIELMNSSSTSIPQSNQNQTITIHPSICIRNSSIHTPSVT